MDLGTHFRAIWHRRYLIAAGAVATAALVYGFLGLLPSTYTAEASAFIVPASSANGSDPTELRRLTLAYLDLVADNAILADAGKYIPGEPTAQRLRSHVTVTSPADGELRIDGTDTKATEAAIVANVVADALARAVSRREEAARLRELQPIDAELADLSSQILSIRPGSPALPLLTSRRTVTIQARLDALNAARNSLDVVRRAQPREAIRSPRVALDSLLAFVLALIVLSEAAAVFAAWRGGLEGRDPVTGLEAWTGLPTFRLPLRAGAADRDETSAALQFLAAEQVGAPIAIAPLTPSEPSRRGVALLVAAAARLDVGTTWIDLGRPSDPGSPPPKQVRVLRKQAATSGQVVTLIGSASTEGGRVLISADSWDSPDLLQAAGLATVTLLLLVDVDTASRADVLEAVRVLTYAGAAPVAVGAVLAPRGSWRPRLRRRSSST